MFCLRTSKGLSVGEFDNTKSHCIFDSDCTCLLGFFIVFLYYACVLSCFQILGVSRAILEEMKEIEQKTKFLKELCI